MLLFQYPDLCEFHLLGRPRRTKEGDLKVRTQRVVEGGQTRSAKLPKATPLNVAEKGPIFFADWLKYAHISIAMPKALTVPAAWEASHAGQMGLEGKTSEIRRQYYTKLRS